MNGNVQYRINIVFIFIHIVHSYLCHITHEGPPVAVPMRVVRGKYLVFSFLDGKWGQTVLANTKYYIQKTD